MIDALPLLLGPEGYQISRSVRLRSSASAYLNRTLTTPTNNLKWTWSGWVKRGTLSVSNVFFGAGDGSSNNFGSLQFTTGNTIQFAQINGGAYNVQMVTSAVFRDPSAWYHLVIIYDSANATSTDRVQIYVNGVRQSVTYSTGPFAQNTASKINSAIAHYTGKLDYAGVYFDGYITENNFIDGQALDPSYFGETNTVTGVWQPKKYTGTYGTNGFYLNFSDNSAATAAAIGADYSGNGNNWTPNNISMVVGVTYDSMLDVPTQWADGGNGRGNYAALNPLDRGGTSVAASDANLKVSNSSAGAYQSLRSTFGLTSGKWYCEFQELSVSAVGSGRVGFGLYRFNDPLTTYGGNTATSWAYLDNGLAYNNASTTVLTTSAYTTADTIMMAFDADNGLLWFGKNGTWNGAPASGTGATYSGLTSGPYFFGGWAYNTSDAAAINFGQRPFSYTPPSGFKALNTLNLPEPTILKGNQYFDVVTRTGTGSSDGVAQVISSLAFTPDLVWNKARSNAFNHNLVDSARGNDAILFSNLTNAETSVGTTGTQLQLTTNGFTAIQRVSYQATNQNGVTYADWCWKEGATQGFDIVTYTGTGVARTVAHNLGVAPKMLLVKGRTNTTDGFIVWHTSIAATQYLDLHLTSALATAATVWNSTSPSSTVFSVGTATGVNFNAVNYVAYLFAEVAGFSKFGSYTGNGSADGPFVFTGFRPRWVMIKRTNSTGNWRIVDTARDTYNVAQYALWANDASAEGSGSSHFIDVVSNGFKIRNTSLETNASGGTYIFAAFAENPLKFSLAR